MNKFKVGNIVVTLKKAGQIPKNLVTKIKEIKSLPYQNGIDCTVQGEKDYREVTRYAWKKKNIRHATKQEEFLYYILGVHVLGKDN